MKSEQKQQIESLLSQLNQIPDGLALKHPDALDYALKMVQISRRLLAGELVGSKEVLEKKFQHPRNESWYKKIWGELPYGADGIKEVAIIRSYFDNIENLRNLLRVILFEIEEPVVNENHSKPLFYIELDTRPNGEEIAGYIVVQDKGRGESYYLFSCNDNWDIVYDNNYPTLAEVMMDLDKNYGILEKDLKEFK